MTNQEVLDMTYEELFYRMNEHQDITYEQFYAYLNEIHERAIEYGVILGQNDNIYTMEH